MNKMKFSRLNTEPPDKLELSAGDLDFYSITLDGYLLMYGKNRYRPDGLRLYVLNNELAKYLGFQHLDAMKGQIRLQWWRGMISVKNLKRRFR